MGKAGRSSAATLDTARRIGAREYAALDTATGQDHATYTYIKLLDAVHQWGETEQALGLL